VTVEKLYGRRVISQDLTVGVTVGQKASAPPKPKSDSGPGFLGAYGGECKTLNVLGGENRGGVGSRKRGGGGKPALFSIALGS